MYGIAFRGMAIPSDPAYPVILSEYPCRNNQDANPTVTTLSRYADAVGKQLLMVPPAAGAAPR